ncbi:MAG: hypothetical protein WAN48_09495 [Actinomycetes bacterium]
MDRTKLLAIGFAMLGAFVGAAVGTRLFASSLMILGSVVVGAAVGWAAGASAAVRQRSNSDS